jgi:hypothetical protein
MKEILTYNRYGSLMTLLILCMLAFGSPTSKAQSHDERKVYSIWLKQANSNARIKGLLYDVKDSAVLVAPRMSRQLLAEANFQNLEIEYDQIQTMKLRRKGNPGRWFGIGFVAGFAAGMIRGYIEGDDPPCTPASYVGLFGFPSLCHQRTAMDKGLSYGVGYALLGGIIGPIIGSFKIKIPLNGSKQKFRAEFNRLEKYSYLQ